MPNQHDPNKHRVTLGLWKDSLAVFEEIAKKRRVPVAFLLRELVDREAEAILQKNAQKKPAKKGKPRQK